MIGRPTTRRSVVAQAVLVVAGVVVALLIPPQVANGSTGPNVGQWYHSYSADQKYPEVNVQWNVPITMSDGTVLKANVFRPAHADRTPVSTKTPTIVHVTPYTKLFETVLTAAYANPALKSTVDTIADMLNFHGTPIDGISDIAGAGRARAIGAALIDFNLIKSGYSYVMVDQRGTGASHGAWQVFGDRERQDDVEVIDWASKRGWSTGEIGMTGASASGMPQIYAAGRRPDALKAIMPMVPGGDFLRSVIAPGGGVNAAFVPNWLATVNTLKWIPDMQQLLNGNFDAQWLLDRTKDPATFVALALKAVLTTSYGSIDPEVRSVLDPNSSYRQAFSTDDADKVTVPTMIVGGWYDIFQRNQVDMYNKIPIPPGEKQLIMGATYHATTGNRGNVRGGPPNLDVLQKAWFDKWLKGVDNGVDEFGPVTVREQGGGWITAPTFPTPGMRYSRLYLSNRSWTKRPMSVYNGSLTSRPNARGRLTISPGLSTLCSRDTAAHATAGLVGIFPFCGSDSRIAETNALTFSSPAVRRHTRISGPVNVHLNAVHDATDGYWVASLNDVAPNGQSVQLTSGQIVSSLRAIDRSKSQFAPNGDLVDPFHPLTLATRKAVTPGQATAIDVGMIPTQAVIAPGHRLRVDVYALNLPTIPFTPSLIESGLRPQHIKLDPKHSSYVTFPSNIPVHGS